MTCSSAHIRDKLFLVALNSWPLIYREGPAVGCKGGPEYKDPGKMKKLGQGIRKG